MKEDIKKWWNDNAKSYQEDFDMSIDVAYGPGASNEESLNLLGDVSGKKILEIGCGAAQCGIYLAKKGANVIGIDISKEQLEYGKRLAEENKVNIKLIEGHLVEFKEIDSNSQDIVLSVWALEYAYDLKKCFKEVNRVLKTDGIFVFSFDHPFWRRLDKDSLKIKKSYFETGEYKEEFKKGTFIAFDRTISEIINELIDSGFLIDRLLEPDSRQKNKGDCWYEGQSPSRKEAMKFIPRTIIFKARKKGSS